MAISPTTSTPLPTPQIRTRQLRPAIHSHPWALDFSLPCRRSRRPPHSTSPVGSGGSGGDGDGGGGGGGGTIGKGFGGCGFGVGGYGGGLGEVFPFAPAVEVDEGLHAAPFHYFAGEPVEVDGLGNGGVSVYLGGFCGLGEGGGG